MASNYLTGYDPVTHSNGMPAPRTLTITVPEQTQKNARWRARALGLPLSTYVQQLIRKDCGFASVLADEPTQPQAVNFATQAVEAPTPTEEPTQ